MYTIHLFDSSEDYHDCVDGCKPTSTVTFVSEDAAIFWLSQEFGEDRPFFCTPSELEEHRQHVAIA